MQKYVVYVSNQVESHRLEISAISAEKAMKIAKVHYEDFECTDVITVGLKSQRELIAENQLELLKEDFDCIHMWLYKKGITRDVDGKKLSVIGRIQLLGQILRPGDSNG